MKKRACLLLFVLILTISSFPVIAINTEYDAYAEKLSQIGVFKGTSSGYELDRQPTRLEGLVMLIRLLGKEDEAKAAGLNQVSIFEDVPPWGVLYTNYAYKNGLTSGIGNNKFGTDRKMDANTFHTFLLRALGYDDAKGDFTWATATDFALQIKMISPYYYAQVKANIYIRDYVAKAAYDSLLCRTKSGTETLLEKLVKSGDIDQMLAAKFNENDDLTIHFLDVGQALCVLIQDDKGNELVYDAGNNGDAAFIIDYFKDQGIDTIEYLVNSHPHEDHIGGMDELLNTFKVETVMMSNATYTTKAYDQVIDLLVAKNIAVTDPVIGQKTQVDDWSFEVLGPMKTQYEEINNYSVVIKVTYGNKSILLTGDAEALVEQEIIASGVNLSADILQVGHHGSASSSTAQFLSKINPKYTVISVGQDNSYGHPDNIVTNRLDNMGVDVRWTQTEGTIVFKIKDGLIEARSYATIGNPDKSTTDRPEQPEEDVTIPLVQVSDTAIIIEALDKRAEYVTIKNTSKLDVNIGGWIMVSETGNQRFIFPSNYIMKPGQVCKLTSGALAGTGDFTMAKTTIWNNSDSDPAVLLDKNGKEIDRY